MNRTRIFFSLVPIFFVILIVSLLTADVLAHAPGGPLYLPLVFSFANMEPGQMAITATPILGPATPTYPPQPGDCFLSPWLGGVCTPAPTSTQVPTFTPQPTFTPWPTDPNTATPWAYPGPEIQ